MLFLVQVQIGRARGYRNHASYRVISNAKDDRKLVGLAVAGNLDRISVIKFLRDKRTDHPHQLLALWRASVFAEKCINLDVNGFAARCRVRDMPDERLSALNVPPKKPLVPIRTGVNQFRCIRHAFNSRAFRYARNA